jgi:hypothetical protein
LATSGTVSQTVFETRKVIDHAFRRCKLTPQQITSESIDTALDLLFLVLSTLSNRGLALWCIQRHLLPLYENQIQVSCPTGTVDVLNANLRSLQRAEGTATASEGTAENAFDGDLETACTQTVAGGNITMEFDSETTVPCYGILPNATGTWDISIQTSDDGATWTTIYTDASFEAVDGEWQWFDIDGALATTYIRLLANGATILNVTEFYLGTNPQSIPMAKLNRDDYSNLPNRTQSGRPVEYQYDRQRAQAYMNVWPAPAAEFTFSQVELWTQRFVEDVGTMAQELEIPQGWYLAIVCELARHCGREIKEVDPQLLPDLDKEAANEMAKAWDGQTDSAPSFLRPDISCYTR